MDNNKDSGTNLAFWLPGGAVILSLVLSTLALTREPFLEPRPIGAQFQSQLPIEARLWQDPFDALERYRKKLTDSEEAKHLCNPDIIPLPEEKSTPDIMVVLVEGGPYADELERRRRIRYALLAGFKNSQRVPDQEQYIHCLKLQHDLSIDPLDNDPQAVDLPYEMFISNQFDRPASDVEGGPPPSERTIVFWLKQDLLTSQPLQMLEKLRKDLHFKAYKACASGGCIEGIDTATLKVIGPSTSTVLLDMYQEEANFQATKNVEIYSPLATADNEALRKSLKPLKKEKDKDKDKDKDVAADKNTTTETQNKEAMKILRTVSDDGTMTKLLLDELKLRRVDPAADIRCSQGKLRRVGTPCNRAAWLNANRIALISEWDSFYSRALIESFKDQVALDARLGDDEKDKKGVVEQWVLRFSYLRGLDGRLPEEPASSDKATSTDTSKNNKNSSQIDLSPLEKADGNSQLDYLRRLADHIAQQDEDYRKAGQSGIGAIGVLGVDTYDKLLVLQALKSRMPYKLYFSTDLDARMLQRGQAEATRNLILAAPYGLALTRALQQDIPPFRDSLQSSVFISVLAALAPQPFVVKRAKFDYSRSELLSPGIYEVGISGFIPLASNLTASRPESCAAPTQSQSNRGIRPHDLMALRCLQDPSPPPYPEPSDALRNGFKNTQSFFWAGPLTFMLLLTAAFIVWWWIEGSQIKGKTPFSWVRGVPMALYITAAACAFFAARFWHAELLWVCFALILLGTLTSKLVRRSERQLSLTNNSPVDPDSGFFDASAWYIIVPLVIFVLVLLLGYQMRSTLTKDGLGEPMFLFEGISAWPTVALRLLAVLISLSAVAWGWRNLRVNRFEIETAYHLRPHMRKYHLSLWGQLPRLVRGGQKRTLGQWCKELGQCLFLVLFPLSTASIDWSKSKSLARDQAKSTDGRTMISISRFWGEHCVCGTFGARMVRALLATWIFVVVTSLLFVVWPMEGIPVRDTSPLWKWTWLIPTVVFQLLVFWVIDANLLLTRFIRHLSNYHAIWPIRLQNEHQAIFGIGRHSCIDDWVDIQLIAKRTSAVNRLIYAPTVVMLILIASRSSVFDNWPTPLSMIISYALTALLLLASALSLRRAAEKARMEALQRIDAYLLKNPTDTKGYDKFRMIRERIATLNTGSFSRYSEEPLVRALLLSLTGIGGSAIVDALNYAKF
ncbi:hypothetical protein BK660_26545 [Pseudomonas brassicacearum]|uniref:Uncharacterized protein n=1 Tax=Pseudomonas brassicacearum TaxID=930166 RepID=A0A423HRX2_9PSED|nr:hypothetical protein [Pseudomonas brassicacearum]RON15907.1 hypothetical protein BK660_26545 [Pseudomonas brassicacearum]